MSKKRKRGDVSPTTPPEVAAKGKGRWPARAPLSRTEFREFAAGTHRHLHERLGAHAATRRGREGVRFSVWAPAARRVSVIGSFNDWSDDANELRPVADSGVWSGFATGVAEGDLYKFRIDSRVDDDLVLDKADPFARRTQLPPGTASVYHELDYTWGDAAWMSARSQRSLEQTPMSVYEMHLGSWRRSTPDTMPTYREVATELVPYLQRMGFTHVELMPITEHPYYASWGYQTTGYFAPTARYGPPEDLMALIDALHQADIGVILDWVPSHFPTDGHGLARFDGTHLFEHADPRLGYHPDWKTLIYNYGRGHVRSFLISSALFWLEQYHVDGIRVDAVASMLYLDYSRDEGQWIPNRYGGRENIEAISFLRELNTAVHERHPDVAMIAEESTAWPMVSRPAYVGGLGFDMKWDMGWMHDTLEYARQDPIHRKFHHDKLTFRSVYAFSERFLLPLSHDEVVHGKASLLGKMPGDDWRRFANLRAFLGYMYGQPGKKLLFMGAELGQWREWHHDRELDWNLLNHPQHAGLQAWIAALNHLYRDSPELHEYDFDGRGFEWIDGRDADHSVICYLRRAAEGQPVLVVSNFTPVPRPYYRIGLPEPGSWSEVLNGDDSVFGGSGVGNRSACRSVAMPHHGRPYSMVVSIPPLATVFWRPDVDTTTVEAPVPGAAIVSDPAETESPPPRLPRPPGRLENPELSGERLLKSQRFSTIAAANSEHLTLVAPSICRARS